MRIENLKFVIAAWLLTLLCLVMPPTAVAQGNYTVLGKTPQDKVLPAFMAQNGNAATLAAGLGLKTNLTTVFSITNWGAAGNNLIDTYGPMTNALTNAVLAGGGVISFPAGHFKFLTNFAVPKNVSIQGVGFDPTYGGGGTLLDFENNQNPGWDSCIDAFDMGNSVISGVELRNSSNTVNILYIGGTTLGLENVMISGYNPSGSFLPTGIIYGGCGAESTAYTRSTNAVFRGYGSWQHNVRYAYLTNAITLNNDANNVLIDQFVSVFCYGNYFIDTAPTNFINKLIIENGLVENPYLTNSIILSNCVSPTVQNVGGYDQVAGTNASLVLVDNSTLFVTLLGNATFPDTGVTTLGTGQFPLLISDRMQFVIDPEGNVIVDATMLFHNFGATTNATYTWGTLGSSAPLNAAAYNFKATNIQTGTLLATNGENVTGGGSTNNTAQGFTGNGVNLTNAAGNPFVDFTITNTLSARLVAAGTTMSNVFATLTELAAQGTTITNVFATLTELATQGTTITNVFATLTELATQGTTITNVFATLTELATQGTTITNVFATLAELATQGTTVTNTFLPIANPTFTGFLSGSAGPGLTGIASSNVTGTLNVYVAPPPLGAVGNLGTFQSPLTLRWAASNVFAGETVLLMDGLYSGPIVVSNAAGGAPAGSPIIFRPLNPVRYTETPWGTVLNPGGVITTNDGIHVTLWKMAVNGTSLSEMSNVFVEGIQINNSAQDGIITGIGGGVLGCWIWGCYDQGINASSSNTLGCVIAYNLIENNGADMTLGAGHYHAIYLGGFGSYVFNNTARHQTNGTDLTVYGGYANETVGGNYIFNNIFWPTPVKRSIEIYGRNYTNLIGGGTAGPFSTNYVFNNHVLGGFASTYGTLVFSNNIVLNDFNGTNGAWLDSFTTNIFGGNYVQQGWSLPNGANNGGSQYAQITNASISSDFVNTANGLYWLKAGSQAIAAAAPNLGLTPPFDFFGRAQLLLPTIGAVNFDPIHAIDTRALDPSTATNEPDIWNPLNFVQGAQITGSLVPTAQLPVGSAAQKGVLQVDGTTITANGSGVISAAVVAVGTTFVQTNVALNSLQTNTSGSVQFITGSAFYIAAATGGGTAAFGIMVSNAGYGAFSNEAQIANGTTALSIAMPYTNNFICVISNGAQWYPTNSSSGAGNSAGVVASTLKVTTIGNAAASGVPSLGGANVLTGNNNFTGQTTFSGFEQATNSAAPGSSATIFSGSVFNLNGTNYTAISQAGNDFFTGLTNGLLHWRGSNEIWYHTNGQVLGATTIVLLSWTNAALVNACSAPETDVFGWGTSTNSGTYFDAVRLNWSEIYNCAAGAFTGIENGAANASVLCSMSKITGNSSYMGVTFTGPTGTTTNMFFDFTVHMKLQ